MKLILLLCALCLSSAAWSAPHSQPQSSTAMDQQLAAILQSLSDGNLSEARILARQTASNIPTSALAQLLAAELAASAAHRAVRAGEAQDSNQPLQELLMEASARLNNRPAPTKLTSADNLPVEVLQLGKGVSDLLLVDLADSTLYHFAVNAGKTTLIQQHYAGSGKAGYGKRLEGDNKTPLGVYRIMGFRSDASLPDLYGAGALTLDYPNALDQFLGRTGSGIWLHGVPHGQRSRSPRSSEGCVSMSNDHLNALQERLSGEQGIADSHRWAPSRDGEPVVLLTHNVQWRDATAREQEQQQFQALFERYQRAWQQRDVPELRSLYASTELVDEQLQRVSSDEASLEASTELTEPQLLNAINKEDISIFYNPSLTKAYEATSNTSQNNTPALPLNGAEVAFEGNQEEKPTVTTLPHLIMQIRMGEFYEYQLTLYWQQNQQGQWQIVTQQRNAISS